MILFESMKKCGIDADKIKDCLYSEVFKGVTNTISFDQNGDLENGDIVVNTDGDGQDDFNEVPKMLKYLNEYDAVFGQRVDRCDPPLKVVSTKIAFFFRRLILKDNLRDSTCPLKVMKKKTLKYLFPLGGFHRFIPFLLKEAGVPCIGVDVNHRSRHAGRSKYYLLRFFVPAIMDLLFMWWYRKTNLYRQRRDVGHKTGNE